MNQYKQISTEARLRVLDLIYKAQTSHIGSNFSCIDILTVLFDKFDCFTIDDLIYKFFNNSMTHAIPPKLISLSVTGLLSISIF